MGKSLVPTWYLEEDTSSKTPLTRDQIQEMLGRGQIQKETFLVSFTNPDQKLKVGDLFKPSLAPAYTLLDMLQATQKKQEGAKFIPPVPKGPAPTKPAFTSPKPTPPVTTPPAPKPVTSETPVETSTVVSTPSKLSQIPEVLKKLSLPKLSLRTWIYLGGGTLVATLCWGLAVFLKRPAAPTTPVAKWTPYSAASKTAETPPPQAEAPAPKWAPYSAPANPGAQPTSAISRFPSATNKDSSPSQNQDPPETPTPVIENVDRFQEQEPPQINMALPESGNNGNSDPQNF